jgi:hypothetical protein
MAVSLPKAFPDKEPMVIFTPHSGIVRPAGGPAFLLRAILLLSISSLGVCCFAADQSYVQKRQLLTEKLDSLELEKQIRKRSGQPLEDLDKAAEQVKDSLVASRRQIASGEESGQQTVEAAPDTLLSSPQPAWRRFVPKNMFDWIVVAVGIVAIISGVVLVVGLVGLFLRRARKKKKPAPPLHEMFAAGAGSPSQSAIPKVPTGTTESKDDGLDQIRQRIRKSQNSTATGGGLSGRENSLPAPELPDANRGGASFADDTGHDPAETKNRVIAAAREGLDVQEISRRFHLSVDQVSLILRISRTDKPGGR